MGQNIGLFTISQPNNGIQLENDQNNHFNVINQINHNEQINEEN